VTTNNQPYFDPSTSDRIPISFEEQVEAMNELIREGKIRYYGVANETPWGIAKWHSTAKALGLKGPVAASNPYSLITKNYVETHLIEAVYHSNMSFIGYSPLCEGVLTGTPRFVSIEHPLPVLGQ
jgi:aryl-alcohol dehydrogenase-like predicted oxidoreductase